MGAAMDTISGYVTAPGSTFTAWTMAAGDSLTIRNGSLDPAKPNWLLNLWALNNAVGTLRVRSPRLHDNVQGIREVVAILDPEPFLPLGVPQKLYPQDTLIVEQSGSGTAGNIETGSLLVYYTDLPGASARFIDYATLQKRIVNIETIAVTLSQTGVGGYTAAVTLNSTVDLTIANTDYALMGFDNVTSSGGTELPGTISVRGPDTANLRCSGPGNSTKKDFTVPWFVRLSQWFGIPMIPVINSANKTGTLIDCTQNQSSNTVTADLIMAQLAPA